MWWPNWETKRWDQPERCGNKKEAVLAQGTEREISKNREIKEGCGVVWRVLAAGQRAQQWWVCRHQENPGAVRNVRGITVETQDWAGPNGARTAGQAEESEYVWKWDEHAHHAIEQRYRSQKARIRADYAKVDQTESRWARLIPHVTQED